MPTDFETFRSVLVYCAAILALPILTFITTKYFFFDPFFGASVSGNVYSAICAVIMLHVALGMFLYKAYSVDEEKKKPEKLD